MKECTDKKSDGTVPDTVQSDKFTSFWKKKVRKKSESGPNFFKRIMFSVGKDWTFL